MNYKRNKNEKFKKKYKINEAIIIRAVKLKNIKEQKKIKTKEKNQGMYLKKAIMAKN